MTGQADLTTPMRTSNETDQERAKLLKRRNLFPGTTGERLLYGAGILVRNADGSLNARALKHLVELAEYCQMPVDLRATVALLEESFWMPGEQPPIRQSQPFVGGKVTTTFVTPTWRDTRAEEKLLKERRELEYQIALAAEQRATPKVGKLKVGNGEPKPKRVRKPAVVRTAIADRFEVALAHFEMAGEGFLLRDFLNYGEKIHRNYMYNEKYSDYRGRVVELITRLSTDLPAGGGIKGRRSKRGEKTGQLIEEALVYFAERGEPFRKNEFCAHVGVGRNTLLRPPWDCYLPQVEELRRKLYDRDKIKRIPYNSRLEYEAKVRAALEALKLTRRPFTLRDIACTAGVNESTIRSKRHEALRQDCMAARTESDLLRN